MRFQATHVRRGRALIKRLSTAKWEFADLLATVASVDTFPVHAGRGIHRRFSEGLVDFLSEFAKEIGCDMNISTLTKYRLTSICWPKEKRVEGCSFSAHTLLNCASDRFTKLKPGMTCYEIQLLKGTNPNFATIKFRNSYENAIKCMLGSISLKKSAAQKIAHLALTRDQILQISSLVGRDADMLDEIIEAAGLIVDDAA